MRHPEKEQEECIMKKFLKEFKAFAMKGNVLDLAIAVVLGAAFGKVVTAVVDIFLNPIVENIKIANDGATGWAGGIVTFIGVVVEFIIIAFVLFLIVKAVNKSKELTKKEEPKPEPTTKTCPYCLSEINIKATRCPCCTSEQPAEEK